MSAQAIQTHSENSDFQHIETLRRNRTKRQKHHEFFVEGVRNINQAIAYGWTINSLVYAGDRQLSAWAKGVLDSARANTHVEVSFELLQKLSRKHKPSELIAIVAMPEDDLSRIPITTTSLILVIDRSSNPGNLGTIIRSCDALGVNGLVMTGHSVDLYDLETIAATTGSLFAVPTVRLPSHKELLPWLKTVKDAAGRLQIVGTSAKAKRTLTQFDFTVPTVLLIGNETKGLSYAYRELCDEVVIIPIQGAATSLNVACATSIILYEIKRQRMTGWQP